MELKHKEEEQKLLHAQIALLAMEQSFNAKLKEREDEESRESQEKIKQLEEEQEVNAQKIKEMEKMMAMKDTEMEALKRSTVMLDHELDLYSIYFN
jgi:Sec7-like guanine-nucleotide exchange factor